MVTEFLMKMVYLDFFTKTLRREKKFKYLHCMCQHLHITLFNRILSFQRSLIPLKRFHLGDVNFCLRNNRIQYYINSVLTM